MKCERTSNWTWTKVGKICKTNLSSYSLLEQWPFVNYLETKGITEGRITETQYLVPTERNLPSRARRKVLKNDIVYSTVRPNQRHYGIIKNPLPNMLVSTGFSVLTVDPVQCDAVFLYYWLSQNCIVETLQSLAEQSVSTYPTIRDTDLGALEIFLPSLPEQKRIAAILSSLDDKIELNNKINANLEQQAQALFKAWFVGNSFNNRGTLGDIAEITMGQSPSGNSYNEDGKGTVFYQGRSEFGFRFPTRRLFTTEPKRMARAGDLLLSVRAPVGDLNVAYENCCIGRGLCALHSRDNMNSFLLYALRSLKPTLDVFNGVGTVFGSISKDDLVKIPVSIPCVDDMARFEAIVRPMDDLIRANYEANCRLQVVRDNLLPKLMSGEISLYTN